MPCCACLRAVEPLFIGATETEGPCCSMALSLHGLTGCLTMAVALTATQSHFAVRNTKNNNPRFFLYLPSHSPLASLPPPRLLLMRAAQPARHTGGPQARSPPSLSLPSLAWPLFNSGCCSSFFTVWQRRSGTCHTETTCYNSDMFTPLGSARHASGSKRSRRSPCSTMSPTRPAREPS